jgi:hypothetical protein
MLNLILETPERWASQAEKMRQDGFVKDLPNVSYEEMKKFTQEEKFRVNVQTRRHVMQNFDKILPILLHRNWLIVRAPKDSGGFITSDHPVVLTWFEPEMRGGFYSPGFGMTGTSVLFPVCTRLAVIGAFEHKEVLVDCSLVEVPPVAAARTRQHGSEDFSTREFTCAAPYPRQPAGPMLGVPFAR